MFSFRMSPTPKSVFGSLSTLAIMMIAVSSCDGGAGGSAAGTTTPGTTQNNQTNANPTSTQSSQPTQTGMITPTCVTSDANHICLAIDFVAYKNSSGTPTVNETQLNTILSTMNTEWHQCNIGFQVEQYSQVDPSQAGLTYGANSQNELDQIRTTYAPPSNMMLAVTTGPWGTAVNAWTNMPGSAPYGAIMEQSIVDYGGGIIYAHEFGHYLGLDHVPDTSDLMNAVIATNSTNITTDQCTTAQNTAKQYWSAMMRH